VFGLIIGGDLVICDITIHNEAETAFSRAVRTDSRR
jgi:hypothetical protein